MSTKEDKPKGRPCPVCQRTLILRYDPRDPVTGHMAARTGVREGRYYVPMRCPGCGINLEIAVDESELVEQQDDY